MVCPRVCLFGEVIPTHGQTHNRQIFRHGISVCSQTFNCLIYLIKQLGDTCASSTTPNLLRCLYSCKVLFGPPVGVHAIPMEAHKNPQHGHLSMLWCTCMPKLDLPQIIALSVTEARPSCLAGTRQWQCTHTKIYHATAKMHLWHMGWHAMHTYYGDAPNTANT